MADEKQPHDEHEHETEGEKELEGEDPITEREALELELMEEGESEKGGEIGEHID